MTAKGLMDRRGPAQVLQRLEHSFQKFGPSDEACYHPAPKFLQREVLGISHHSIWLVPIHEGPALPEVDCQREFVEPLVEADVNAKVLDACSDRFPDLRKRLVERGTGLACYTRRHKETDPAAW